MRLLAILFATALFTISTFASAQNHATQNSSASNDARAGFIYPAIGAAYVGGTIADMPLKAGNPLMRWLSFSKRQFRVNGQLALGPDGLIFAFNGNPPLHNPGEHFELWSCDSHQLPGDVRTACIKTAAKQALRIPYDQLIELSRAKAATSDIASATTVYASTAVGILSTVVGAFSKSHEKELYGGITAGTLALGYYFLVSRPRSGDNYIAVFICPQNNGSCTPGEIGGSNPPSTETDSTPKTTVKTGSDELFKQGDLMMFKIPNSHDYYNISMILSAKTGKTFVSETAEKGGK